VIRVWVTRDEPPGGPLGEALREAGLEPVHEPVITRQACSDAGEELSRLNCDDWLVLTSAFALKCLALECINRDLPPHVAAVGDATATAAAARGLRVDLTANGGADALFALLRQRVTRGSVCYPRSSLADIPESWGDVTVSSPAVYETLPRDFDRAVMMRVNIAAMTSPSAVNVVGRVDLPMASIGPATTATIRAFGMEPQVEASSPSFDLLARAIAEAEINSE